MEEHDFEEPAGQPVWIKLTDPRNTYMIANKPIKLVSVPIGGIRSFVLPNPECASPKIDGVQEQRPSSSITRPSGSDL